MIPVPDVIPAGDETMVEKQIRHEVIYTSPSYQFCVDQVELPNGAPGVREYVKHPGGVAILAVNDNRQCVMVRQYRHAVHLLCDEIPAGKLDKIPGETPLDAARRELREETGLLAENWTELGYIYPSPGICSERLHLFFASGLQSVERELDDDEFIQVLWVPLEALSQGIADNRITDVKAIAALFRSRLNRLL